MKSILDRLQAMERLMPSMVTILYPDGTQTVVEALEAFEMAVYDKGVTILCPRQSAHAEPSASRGGCCR